ncbi:DUF4345 domain-containing protein [Nocardia sp. NRRL S-836]|uniref:DUF4345 domain-containing protein n=1 Tax=Nocardia sp. NRRL S-836 TaxID=1519492 RepID=UPI0006B03F9E|nr:DUF4345 domain-containing protein [Nocardia sp. NRRL S-836]KOV85072.1 hypothetical protein ADL03_12240 [Nocardia sp. NRRL S-836]
MAVALRALAWTMGVACVLIGAYHVVLGVASVPGAEDAGATVDSRERFYNAIFLGYGLAWVWVARQRPVPATAVRRLAGVFALSAVGRLLSLAVHGQPHWFQLPLIALEVVLPPVFFWLAASDEKRVASTRL